MDVGLSDEATNIYVISFPLPPALCFIIFIYRAIGDRGILMAW